MGNEVRLTACARAQQECEPILGLSRPNSTRAPSLGTGAPTSRWACVPGAGSALANHAVSERPLLGAKGASQKGPRGTYQGDGTVSSASLAKSKSRADSDQSVSYPQ